MVNIFQKKVNKGVFIFNEEFKNAKCTGALLINKNSFIIQLDPAEL